MRLKLYIIPVAIMFISLVIAFHVAHTEEDELFSPFVDKDGNIARPIDFKETWTFLGAWTLPDKNADGMHLVYTQPGMVAEYKKNGGKFPDGAVLVKEVRSIQSEAMTTGPDVIHAEDETLWFVMVKDEKGRFPDNPLWGEGWGWALYYAKDPSKNVATDYKKDCLVCHVPAKQTDWIYSHGYPLLQKEELH